MSDCFTGFAPVFNEQSDLSRTKSLPKLRFNQEEVKQIAALFKQQEKEAKIYLGSEATEERFKALNFSKYIHIATHSIANEDAPELSALYFSGALKDSLSDNVLYADEVFSLKLNSELIVLSSCETGLGKIIKGEGILALTRGFIYHGIPNLLFSLWKVSDHSTNYLMVEFYRNVLSGMNYKSALRDSKLKMLSNEFTSFPDKWGAFILIGI